MDNLCVCSLPSCQPNHMSHGLSQVQCHVSSIKPQNKMAVAWYSGISPILAALSSQRFASLCLCKLHVQNTTKSHAPMVQESQIHLVSLFNSWSATWITLCVCSSPSCQPVSELDGRFDHPSSRLINPANLERKDRHKLVDFSHQDRLLKCHWLCRARNRLFLWWFSWCSVVKTRLPRQCCKSCPLTSLVSSECHAGSKYGERQACLCSFWRASLIER